MPASLSLIWPLNGLLCEDEEVEEPESDHACSTSTPAKHQPLTSTNHIDLAVQSGKRIIGWLGKKPRCFWDILQAGVLLTFIECSAYRCLPHLGTNQAPTSTVRLHADINSPRLSVTMSFTLVSIHYYRDRVCKKTGFCFTVDKTELDLIITFQYTVLRLQSVMFV